MKSLLFSDPMVRALLAGRKTQTRRIVKPQPHDNSKWGLAWVPKPTRARSPFYCQRNANWDPITKAMENYGAPLKVGDLFYARETWLNNALDGYDPVIFYRADDATKPEDRKWSSPLHLKAADARLFFRCTGVKAERVNAISDSDAYAEGIIEDNPFGFGREAFSRLWDSINGAGSFERGPWVWAYTFTPVTREEALAATTLPIPQSSAFPAASLERSGCGGGAPLPAGHPTPAPQHPPSAGEILRGIHGAESAGAILP